MNPFSSTGGRAILRMPTLMDNNLQAFRQFEDARIDAALAASNFTKAIELAKEILLDPELDYLSRFKYETLLATLCDRGQVHHVERAEEAYEALEELVEHRIEHPKQEDIIAVKKMRKMLNEIKDDLRGRGLVKVGKADEQADDGTAKKATEQADTPTQPEPSEMNAWSGKQAKLARLFQDF